MSERRKEIEALFEGALDQLSDEREAWLTARCDDATLRAEVGRLLVTAYSPLAHGELPEDETLQRIAEEHGKTPEQVTLRWLIQHGDVAAIPKASSRAHAEANFDIFDFELDQGDLAQIAQLPGGTRIINPSWAPQWDAA